MSTEFCNEGKQQRISQSIEIDDYEWEKPKSMPKKGKIIWVENQEMKPVEVRVMKVLDNGKFSVADANDFNQQWAITNSSDNWSEERPVIRSPDSSLMEFHGFGVSTSEEGNGAKGNERKSLLDKIGLSKT